MFVVLNLQLKEFFRTLFFIRASKIEGQVGLFLIFQNVEAELFLIGS